MSTAPAAGTITDPAGAGSHGHGPSAPVLLRLMRLASPALPVGGFSYSEGLEAAVEADAVTTGADTAAWLLDQLHLGLARSDLGIVGDAIAAARRDDFDALAALNTWVSTTRESAESRLQTEQMGRSMVEWLKHHRDPALDDPPRRRRLAALQALAPAPTWPIAFAFAASETGASARDGMLAFGFGWAEAMVQAALKAVPLGQNAGQRVLETLIDTLPAAIDAAAERPAAERQAFLPMLAIHAARHETQYSRLFRS